MYLRNNKIIRSIALLLVAGLANTFVFAGINNNSVKPDDVLITGVLSTPDDQSVKVNGNPAQDGMTILSGAEITTSKTSGATINLSDLGKVELKPETNVKLYFTVENVDLQVVNGQAQLTTFKGIKGVLSDVDGKIFRTDSSLEVSSVMSGGSPVPDSPKPVPDNDETPGFGNWGTILAVGGVVGGAITAWSVVKNTPASKNSVSRVQP